MPNLSQIIKIIFITNRPLKYNYLKFVLLFDSLPQLFWLDLKSDALMLVGWGLFSNALFLLIKSSSVKAHMMPTK